MRFLQFLIRGILVLVVCSCGSLLSLEEAMVQIINSFNTVWAYFWSITFSICVCTTVGSSSGELKKSIGTFWHLTDLHVDYEYSRTGNPEDLCHESVKMKYADNGMYGNFLCDAPWSLVDLTIESMKKIEPEPDFILWTGDNLPHTRNPHPDWNVTFQGIRNITGLLRKMFPDTPIYPSIGNHDTFPPNILQANYSSRDNIYEGYLQTGMWQEILPDSALSTFRRGGFYSTTVSKGLRMISLNTILWYHPNKLVRNISDPSGQFDWLLKELKNADTAKEMVYIIGHVPPGFYNRVYPGAPSYETYHPKFLVRYMDIIKKYSHVISGQYFAHIHNDMFQIYNYESVIDVGYGLSSGLLASSVTPWYSNSSKNVNISIPVNPSIRLFQYSKSDWMPLNYLQYYLNLSRANDPYSQAKYAESGYELLYSFTEVYAVPNLSAESLVKVFEKLKTSPSLFDTFYKYLTSGKESVPCDNNCKSAQLCAMSCMSSEHYNMCMKKAVNTKKSWDLFPLSSRTLTTALVTGFVCLAILAIGALFIYRFRKKVPSENKEYMCLSEI